MKKAFIFAAVFALILSLCACSRKDLAEMTRAEGDGYAAIVWDGRTYVPYGALASYGKRGEQIGIVDGDADDRVYELKGYPPEEWIVNGVPHDPAMLLREINVAEIPDGWQSEYDWNN